MTPANGGREMAEHRDAGPYESVEQALAQLMAMMHEISFFDRAQEIVGELVLIEALLLRRVSISEWEQVVLSEITRTLPPEAAQVIAGWLLRAPVRQVVECSVVQSRAAGPGNDCRGGKVFGLGQCYAELSWRSPLCDSQWRAWSTLALGASTGAVPT
ncbi:hypothetical protein ACQP2F_15465 [Actinoplanes sp. CA-030573]|uniref:hypothetical protein n=1 Tax=Actinoplanes sp. CA-030573 TaxID=3239898 RepID=UPI003D89DDD0